MNCRRCRDINAEDVRRESIDNDLETFDYGVRNQEPGMSWLCSSLPRSQLEVGRNVQPQRACVMMLALSRARSVLGMNMGF